MKTTPVIKSLRAQAISHSLFTLTTLPEAIKRLKFIQADPIRSPARAQDLILRHRVKGYKAGDLEREYPALDLEEDVLYAYGFIERDVWRLLHPRKSAELPWLEQEILETVISFGEMHPRQLEAHFGRERVINAWGGYSKATTRALEKLHYHGLLRIVRRTDGIRVYESTSTLLPSGEDPLSLSERLKRLVIIVANIFAPVTEQCLREALALLRRALPSVDTKTAIADLINSGELKQLNVDAIKYLTLPDLPAQTDIPRRVRLLAPFDPLIWDRRRFEHFWGWAYRFEAYTPAAKRLRGYYAMPMLWGDDIIGWANVKVENGNLIVEPGFVGKKPGSTLFSSELEKEIERLKFFLNLKHPSQHMTDF